jgi:hypothetical protein
MKLGEIGSGLSLPSMVSNTFGFRSNPRPCSNRLVSFTSVYSQAGRVHSWLGAMHFDKKSNNTIIDI